MSNFTRDELVTAVLSVLGRKLDEVERAYGKSVNDIPLQELNFDSLSILELVIIIEDKYGVSLNPSEFALTADANIDQLFKYVSDRTG